MNEPEDASEWLTVGGRIRASRETAGMSIRELGRRIDVSASHVSQVERGLAAFSVRALYNVVSALGISMDSLFEEAVTPEGEPIVPLEESVATAQNTPLDEAGIVLRGNARPAIRLKSGPRWERLTPRAEDGAEFIEVVYDSAPGGQPSEDFIRHGGREYGVIVSGTLNAQVGFSQTQMHVGDSIAFDSNIPHRFWNSSAEPVRAVWFVLDERVDSGARSVAASSTERHSGF
ncbi:MAG: cupin domain-containing protein [Cryobacterium sp.]|nr:cupin domain-containing protein [Cryobacterium sp.]